MLRFSLMYLMLVILNSVYTVYSSYHSYHDDRFTGHGRGGIYHHYGFGTNSFSGNEGDFSNRGARISFPGIGYNGFPKNDFRGDKGISFPPSSNTNSFPGTGHNHFSPASFPNGGSNSFPSSSDSNTFPGIEHGSFSNGRSRISSSDSFPGTEDINFPYGSFPNKGLTGFPNEELSSFSSSFGTNSFPGIENSGFPTSDSSGTNSKCSPGSQENIFSAFPGFSGRETDSSPSGFNPNNSPSDDNSGFPNSNSDSECFSLGSDSNSFVGSLTNCFPSKDISKSSSAPSNSIIAPCHFPVFACFLSRFPPKSGTSN